MDAKVSTKTKSFNVLKFRIHLLNFSVNNTSKMLIFNFCLFLLKISKVQGADLMCDVIRKVAPFVLSKLWIIVADWSMRWSRDTLLKKLRLYFLHYSLFSTYIYQIQIIKEYLYVKKGQKRLEDLAMHGCQIINPFFVELWCDKKAGLSSPTQSPKGQ